MIVLLTDFGTLDPYVAIMKGVIKKVSPNSEMIDLSHHIKPQNIQMASFYLQNSYHYFPKGTVFLCVIDPGVGTQRNPVLIKTDDYFFIGPDNGLFSFIEHFSAIYKLDNPDYFLTHEPGNTFHGRDIFAPVAAWIDKGEAAHKIGSAIDSIQKTTPQPDQKTKNEITVPLLHVDNFGNLIFSLDYNDFKNFVENHIFKIQFKEFQTNHISANYETQESLIALFNSYNLLEIASPGSSAAKKLNLDENAKIDQLKVIVGEKNLL